MAVAGKTSRAAIPAYRRALTTTNGTKALIALTGIGLVGFLLVHLAGNITFLFGPEAFNAYSHKLTSTPILYVGEAGLLGLFLLHIVKALGNYGKNRSARGDTGYAFVPGNHLAAKRQNGKSRKTLASSSSIVTGIIVIAFVILHLKGLKFGHSGEMMIHGGTPEAVQVRDIYATQLEYFRNPVMVGIYVICVGLLGFHLWHGIWSVFQTFGLANSRYLPLVTALGKGLTLLITLGFMFFPIYTHLVAIGAVHAGG